MVLSTCVPHTVNELLTSCLFIVHVLVMEQVLLPLMQLLYNIIGNSIRKKSLDRHFQLIFSFAHKKSLDL